MNDKFIEQAEASIMTGIEEKIAKAGLRAPRPAGFNDMCECGQSIPLQRVQLGYYCCVPCQSRKEKQG
jgi:RNA polymerase-binding transcription factor DksA